MSNIKVTPCYGSRPYFRLTLPDGSRENIPGDTWTRATAAEALDILQHVYGLDRAAVRFIHD